MKYYKIIFIGSIIISIIFLVLSFILGELFILFPSFFILPLSCAIRRRAEETMDTEINPYGEIENHEIQQQNEAQNSNIDEKRCSSCNNIILEQNLRFCPHCGKRIKK